MALERLHAQQSCFNNPACWREQVGTPHIRGKTNVLSWDMDTGSFQSQWAWHHTHPLPDFEGAGNYAAFEWTMYNLSWDQRDSCAQARGTGNSVVCLGLKDWCSWQRRFGFTRLSTEHGNSKFFFADSGEACGLPTGWHCLIETRVRLNGFSRFKDQCGGGQAVVGPPINPIPGDTNDPRMNATCMQRPVPTLVTEPNTKQITVHEFGHGLFFDDVGHAGDCGLPLNTVMEPFDNCGLLLACPSEFHTLNDEFGVRFLYGP